MTMSKMTTKVAPGKRALGNISGNRMGLALWVRRCFISRNVMTFLCLSLLSISACAQGSIPISWDHHIGINHVSPKSLSDIDGILKRKWMLSLENKDITQSFNVQGGGGKHMVVDSCQTLFEADKLGLEKTDSYREFKIYRFWAASCYALRALSRATEASQSFVQNFTLDADHVRDLPVGMAGVISNSDVRKMLGVRQAGGTLGHYIGDNPIRLQANGPGNYSRSASIIYSPVKQNIHILGEADFNKDGVQDILISTSISIEGGSYAACNLFVITRMKRAGPFEIIKQFPVMGPSVMASDQEQMKTLERQVPERGSK